MKHTERAHTKRAPSAHSAPPNQDYASITAELPPNRAIRPVIAVPAGLAGASGAPVQSSWALSSSSAPLTIVRIARSAWPASLAQIASATSRCSRIAYDSG